MQSSVYLNSSCVLECTQWPALVTNRKKKSFIKHSVASTWATSQKAIFITGVGLFRLVVTEQS